MVTKSKAHTIGEKEEKKGRVKVGKLKLNKETVKDLTNSEAKRVKGGQAWNADGTSGAGSCQCYTVKAPCK
jgi:natural product precursor